MHLQPVFALCEMHGGSVSEDLFERGLCLPSGSSLTAEEQTTVIGVLATTPATVQSTRGAAHA
jgi:pyridoxal phosphate-dependent aminotransferase EpsN